MDFMFVHAFSYPIWNLQNPALNVGWGIDLDRSKRSMIGSHLFGAVTESLGLFF